MSNNFKELGIKEKLVDLLSNNGIKTPTPIQEKAIPKILDGKDIIGEAQTGTGKTLAFLLPIIEGINVEKNQIQALIMAPTRELAIQITQEAKKLSEPFGINILAIYGGQDVFKQLKKLENGVHLVIGTPGRLLDHMRRDSINLGYIKYLVLDEADVMLNMGFLNDMQDIISNTPKRRQTMLFSATIPKGLKALAKRYMKEPETIKIESTNIILDDINQIVIKTTDRGKEEALINIIKEENPFMAIIFCRTKRRVKTLNIHLQEAGFITEEIHGDLSQAKRERVIKSFRKMEIPLLVATDVAARGLDIEGITHVFNYDIPEDPDSYIHRIGRTGRAGEKGKAYTFVTPKNEEDLISIEKKINTTLKSKDMNKNKGQITSRSSKVKSSFKDKEKPLKGNKWDKNSSGKGKSIEKNKSRGRKARGR
ncbi:DEAD/DEAH box helicase [Tissierella creatinophila]|uniref:DEAD-box ATP-dependent RNA helicase CshA n=1 Tax=Tissierella creatinophila DSM 6911 TaxID=1123403 RepID=A0A1U7M2E3_TISCR|nr:DEAD/DEAH box helicase [Tissierella creatinophila]OLS01482.1 DEAD-box ATP-dependent RNA helicase CshA [Tissierella creatinophila DSM 6911]